VSRFWVLIVRAITPPLVIQVQLPDVRRVKATEKNLNWISSSPRKPVLTRSTGSAGRIQEGPVAVEN
jgi:hypothetical protein